MANKSIQVRQSTSVALFNPDAVELIAQMLKSQGAAKVGGGFWPYIGTRGATFSVNKKNVGNEFVGVIIGVAAENRFYEGEFDPQSPQPPACFAITHAEGEPVEAAAAIEAMAPPEGLATAVSKSCKLCPNNAWGSEPKRGRGKACKNQRRLIVLSQSKDYSKAQGFRLSVPVMSVRNLAEYEGLLDGIPFAAVETTFTLTPLPGGGYDLSFAPAGESVDDSVIRSTPQLRAILSRATAGLESLLAPPQTEERDEPVGGKRAAQERRVVQKPVNKIVAGKRR